MFMMVSKRIFILYLLSFVLLMSTCSRVKYSPSGRVQRGLASWYGPKFHGRLTSSKEVYDMHDMTAAHKTLPFGTFVMVTNLNNGKSVVVRINDRGPFVKGRIIDLSYAAARVLSMVGPGVVPVKVEILEGISPKKSTRKFAIQVGAFIYQKNANALKKNLQKGFKNVYISVFKTSHQTYYRVRIRAKTMESARKTAKKLLRKGYAVFVLEESTN
jgi:rare lipoprotein A